MNGWLTPALRTVWKGTNFTDSLLNFGGASRADDIRPYISTCEVFRNAKLF
jgi:hypothetical protein